MSKFIFVSFPDEAKAYEGTRALEALHAEGSLTLYGLAVVAKGLDGKLLVKRESDGGPLGIAVGSLAGGLIGLLGGPVGVAIGMGGGAFLGSLNDLANLGVSSEFIDEVSKGLTPGNVALLAEVSEEWVTPLNARMSALGGTVHRTWRAGIEDELSQKEMASVKAELSQLRAEYEHAKTETRAALKARIDALEALEHKTSDRLHTRMTVLTQETEAKLKSLQAQAIKATGDLKSKLENRIAELQLDGERRSAQLKQAWGLTKKALAS
jgi:uncharacterized membrane protein